MAGKGQPKTGGRQKGSRNLATAEVKELALSYAPEALKTLVRIATDTKAPHAAQVAASKELLDRGIGKSVQMTITADATERQVKTLADFYGEGK